MKDNLINQGSSHYKTYLALPRPAYLLDYRWHIYGCDSISYLKLSGVTRHQRAHAVPRPIQESTMSSQRGIPPVRKYPTEQILQLAHLHRIRLVHGVGDRVVQVVPPKVEIGREIGAGVLLL